jgi:orotate phosphoribosyltransferase
VTTNRNDRFARRAVQFGLLLIAPDGEIFPGRQGGPAGEVLIDARGVSASLALRTLVLGALANALLEFGENTVVGGVSRGGLVLGAQLALLAGRPFASILPEGPRESGARRAVEGDVSRRDVVLFDNITTSGDSLRRASVHATSAGGRVVGALVVGTYGTVPSMAFPVRTITNLDELVEAAHELGLLSSARRNRILGKAK